MDVLHARCCGIDIHKKTAVACVIMSDPNGSPRKQVRTFGTMTDDLLALADWLAEQGVTHVAMESTGVYWKAPFNLLEGQFEVLLANAQHIKAVPGRKTDVQDAEWIADLLRHGLLKASFVPDRSQRELRELTRYRTSLVRERATETNRLQKTLEGANVKLGDVASNILGQSARQMLEGLVVGTDPAILAQFARGRMREKIPQLERALAGRCAAHQRFLIAQQLAHIDYLDEAIERLSAEVAQRLAPFLATLERLDAIPGIARRTAEIVLAEVGPDVRRFPTAGHLASWAGVCPGQHESAGKQTRGTIREGNPWLRAALVEAAQAAAHSKTSYLAAQYQRIARRRGGKKAALAVGHSILVIIWHLLEHECPYVDLGSTYFDERDHTLIKRRLVHRLEQLGYGVTLTRSAA
jgi:transposase